MEGAPTEEVVAALLDYLVDPMLPLRASVKDPPLETQEAVAKQMHAVVLLYNYYHREQNPWLEFLEFEAFCKLAVNLKPALIAHMKYMPQADSIGSDDMENQLSVTEKAIKDACKISLALTSLNNVSDAEGWPVSKISVLLVDSEKENCVLLFGAITNGVWAVIEKCLNISDIPPEGPSKAKQSNKRKRKGEKVSTGEQSDRELAVQQTALSAVEEATGINQSEVTVLEKHVTYSLSEEKMAAYFYIMQCIQSSNEDIQIPIKGVIESLQGPLLERTPHDWMLTQKIEYFNVLPYAQIMSGWLSREGVSACSQILNLSSSCEAEKNSEIDAAEIEKVKSNDLHNLIVELENVNSIIYQGPESPSDGKVQDNMGSIDENYTGSDSCGGEPTGADSSNRKEEVDDKEKPNKNSPEKPSHAEPTDADGSNRKEEVDDKEKPNKNSPEKPSDAEPTGADSSNRKEEVDDKEKPNENSPEIPSDAEPTGAGSSNRKEEVDEKEKPNKNSPEKPSDAEPTGVDSSNRKEEVDDKEKPNKNSPEKPSDAEPIGADSSNKKEEIDDEEKHGKNSLEKPCDMEPSGASSFNRKDVDNNEKPDKCTPEKPSDREVQDNSGSIYGNCSRADLCGKEQTGAENSNLKPEVDDKEKPDEHSAQMCSGEPSGADSFNRKEEVNDHKKPDNNTPEKHSDREVQDKRYRDCAGTEPTGEDSNMKEEIDNNEKSDKHYLEMHSDGEPSGAGSFNREEVDEQTKPNNNTPEKPSDREVQDKRYRDFTGADSCGKMPTGEENSNKEEIDDNGKLHKHSPELHSDGEPTGANRYNSKRKEVDDGKKPNKCAPEKPSDGDIEENVGSIYGNCHGAISCSEEPIEADSFNRKEVDEKEKLDKCCDITNSNTLSFGNTDAGALKMTSEELQVSSNFSSKRQKTDIDGVDIPCPRRGGKNRNASMPIRVYHHQKRKKSVENAPGSSVAVTRCNMETSIAMKSDGTEFIDGKVAGICIQGSISSLNDIRAADGALVPYDPNSNDIEKLQTVLVTKETEISETALRVLLQKREEMCLQQRILEDKIALCNRDIQKIIDGDEDALALKLEAMIDCCNDMCLKGKTQIEGENYQSDVQRTGQCSRRNRLSDAILTFQSPCQELDDICHANNWRLPSYSVSVSTGGFVANVTMKEMEFDFSFEGSILSTPHAARDSAAALMVAKLREI